MAQLIYAFDVTIPAGTAINAGWSQQCNFPTSYVERIDVRVPPGPRGFMGFAIGSSGTPVIPYQGADWIVTDDEALSWPVTDQMDSGAWEVFGYNLGRSPHTIYVRFLADPTAGTSLTTVPTVIAGSSLSS